MSTVSEARDPWLFVDTVGCTLPSWRNRPSLRQDHRRREPAQHGRDQACGDDQLAPHVIQRDLPSHTPSIDTTIENENGLPPFSVPGVMRV